MRRTAFLVVAALAACSEPSSAPPPPNIGDPGARRAEEAPARPVPMDDAFYEFGRAHRGFGGLMIRTGR